MADRQARTNGSSRPFRVVSDPGSRRTHCLLTDLHPERGLSAVLRQTLAAVLPDVDFVLEPADPRVLPDAVWLCGYEPEAVNRIREVRRRFPASLLLVTSGRGGGDWEQDAIVAGADHALEWPCSMSSLSSLLSPGPSERELSG